MYVKVIIIIIIIIIIIFSASDGLCKKNHC